MQNWAEMIERDLLVLEDMMDDVERGDLERNDDMNGVHSDGDDHVHGGVIHEVEGNGHGMNGVSNGDTSNGNLKNQKKNEPRKGWFGWW